MVDYQLKVGGWWLSQVGAWSGLTWSHRNPGGCWEASWTMAGLPADFHHDALNRGRAVEVYAGAKRLWKGVLGEPDRESWQVVATGLAQEANNYLCLDGAGNATSVLDTAIDAAIARGLPWKRLASLHASAWSAAAATDGLNYLDQLLDGRLSTESNRWWVDADGVIGKRPDATTPMWQVTPGSAVLGVAGDEYASRAFARYLDSASSTYKTETAADLVAEARWGRREVGIDLTPLGAISNTKAQSVVSNRLSKGAARPGWTNDLNPSAYELTNMGGTPAELGFVQAGQMVRLHGVLDPRIVATTLDVVIAESTYSVDDNALTLRPMGRAVRTLADAMAAQQPNKFKG